MNNKGVSKTTIFAEKLVRELSGYKVVNHDVDYTKNWKKHYPGGTEDIYILQTPHGADSEETQGPFAAS